MSILTAIALNYLDRLTVLNKSDFVSGEIMPIKENVQKLLVKCYRVGTTNQVVAGQFDFKNREATVNYVLPFFCWKIFAPKQTRRGRSEKKLTG